MSAQGERAGTDGRLEAIYAELKALAHSQLRSERTGHTLQTTALVHEAWMRLAGSGAVDPTDRARFVAVASRAIRRVLVDYARGRRRLRRGGGIVPVRIDLSGLAAEGPDGIDFLDLHLALEDLERLDERAARIVELRFFGGLTAREAARAIGVSVRTADGDWEMARRWLRRRLSAGRIP